MKGKSSSRFNILLFSVAIFIVSCIAYTGWLVHALLPWLIFVLVVVFLLLFAFANDILVVRFKWSAKKVLLLTLSIMVMAAIVMQSAWTIVTPSWSFSVATDKSTYKLGEDVNIRASLKNTGFITHSFKSKVNNPVLIFVTQLRDPPYWDIRRSIWWNEPWKENITEFSILPSQSLERSFIWNQTNIWSHIDPAFSWNQTYMPGTYEITAFIPDAQAEVINPFGWGYAFFIASINIKVASS